MPDDLHNHVSPCMALGGESPPPSAEKAVDGPSSDTVLLPVLDTSPVLSAAGLSHVL